MVIFTISLPLLFRISTLDPRLTREELKALWKAVDPGNAGVAEVQAIHNLLSGNFGVDKVTQRSAGVIERVIKKILERCGENAGIKGLQRYVGFYVVSLQILDSPLVDVVLERFRSWTTTVTNA